MSLKKVDLEAIENSLNKILEISAQTRLFQDQLENSLGYERENEEFFREGKISKKVYEKNKAKIEKEKKMLSSKIDANVLLLQENTSLIENELKNCRI